jgi:hypothetical protein
MAETVAAIDAATLVIALLETPPVITNTDAIAAVPGIDSLQYCLLDEDSATHNFRRLIAKAVALIPAEAPDSQ